MVPRGRIELPSAPCKGAALPLDERGIGAASQNRTGVIALATRGNSLYTNAAF